MACIHPRYIFIKSIKKLHTMSNSILLSNSNVKGLKTLDKNLFTKIVQVPCLQIQKDVVSKAMHILKKYCLKLEKFKAVQQMDSSVLVYLNPELVNDWKFLSASDVEALSLLGISNENFLKKNLTLTYDNYPHEAIFKCVFPEDISGFSSFTKVGHILQVNLKEHLIPYKKLIGQVLLDKVKNCKSVVNKLDMIDNEYRNFQMEVLCGDNNMLTSVKENNCTFGFDFSTVYWNSRLSTEHERIVEKLNSGDVFIDVFAGVGPFSVPIAKKKCYVYANDLNPESFKWFNHNIDKNKIDKRYIKTFNKDGNDFIRSDVKAILLEHLNKTNIHIAMNLPALAVEFIDSFSGLLGDTIFEITNAPIIYVYCFAKGSELNTDYKAIARNLLLTKLDLNDKIVDIFEVRTVSNFKKMIRISVRLDGDILFAKNDNRKRKIDTEVHLSEKNFKYNNGKEKDCQSFQSGWSQESQS